MAGSRSFFRIARRSGLCLCGLFFLIIGGIFTAAGIAKLLPELHYQNSGIPIRGTVVSKSIEKASGRQSSTRYIVVYRFTPKPGETLEANDEVTPDLWDELKKDDPFEVVYLPGSPQSSRSAATTEMPLALGFTGIGAFVFLIGGIAVIIGVRAINRQLRLEREGILVEATVLAKFVSGSDNCIRYRYHDPAGREYTRCDDTIGAEEYNRWKAGDVGYARFDPQNPGYSVWLGTEKPH
jgi:hypothetical protein